ncbi:acetyltransferase [Yersinia enterocolitica]|nr:acetyltransferase [Yersinia enterocolitica]NQT44853.1 acetyltransferase [Yersinia enterocolitica]NQT99342.1 acetyltransferase [Yersinia enterocolitica]
MEIIQQTQRIVIGVITKDRKPLHSIFDGVPFLSYDEIILSYSPEDIDLVNGIGALPGNNEIRENIYSSFSCKGYRFASVISPHAYISKFSILEEGVQIMASATIQVGASIGKNTIVNTGAIVDHDCIVGPHNHIAPGAVLSGGVRTHPKVHIGTGANIIQGIDIGENCIIAAGVTINKSLPDHHIAYASRVVTKELPK